MKKSIFTFAVFSLIVLTSFTTVPTGDDSGDDNGDPTTSTTARQGQQDTGGDHVGGNKKHDIVAPIVIPYASEYPSQDIQTRKKTDF